MKEWSPREWGWALWLSLLPWAPFLLTKQLDLWHAQTAWLHGGLLVLATTGLGTPQRSLPNRPLAIWLLWGAGLSLWLWHQGMLKTQGYPLNLLMATGHVATLGLLWVVLTSQVSKDFLPGLWRAVAYSAAILVGYGAIQVCQIDQFFTPLDGFETKRSLLVGLLGNPNHFGVFLAMSLPLFLAQPERWWKGLALITGLLILLTNSLGAYLAGMLALSWWMVGRWRHGVWLVVGLLTLAFSSWWSQGFQVEASQRETVWPIYWNLWLQKPLTGFGPGFVMDLSRGLTAGHPLFTWRHCHNEYLQLALEQGLIGLTLATWLVAETLQRAWTVRRQPLGAACGAMLLAVLANSLVNFPLHLATIATWTVLATATVWLLSETRTT